ncbi:hypothetical protein P3T76_007165 [Phytophthora citrophthora]|uniref:Uncharacterized protein n=1 Tax=Phytophthora citrophthora TaxID=4793 RepID=A0AAD9GMT7_9STRA|nr:hypothetical protein P3T76_007165 [Phytophthora citrophthora]
MARPRCSLSTYIDPLFEFDASQAYVDLSAPLPPFVPGEHDPWFDEPHEDHSKPSEVLARELAETMRKLQEKEQPKETKSSMRRDWSLDKENQQPTDLRQSVAGKNKQLQLERRKFTSLKEMRAKQEPFKLQKVKEEAGSSSEGQKKSRRPLMDVGNKLNSNRKRTRPTTENKEMKDLQKLLKQHNKKFKAAHTYEPPQHSVREWEREMNKSYYALSAEERVQANQEITLWKQRRQAGRDH